MVWLERSPPPPPLDTRTCTARGLLMPRPRLIPPFCTEPTDTELTPMPVLPMALTPTPTDTVWPESLATQVPPPPSSPGPPRVLARGLLMPIPPFFSAPTDMAPLSPDPPTAMALPDTPLPRVTPDTPTLSSPSTDCTK